MSRYIYDRFSFTDEYKAETIEFIKHNTNAEMGGSQIYDGSGTHLLQNPYEITDFIFALKEHEKESGKEFNKFLEIGFNAGINNTLLNKFFSFDEIVAVDVISSSINGVALKGNLMHKNMCLICGDSTSQKVIEKVGMLGKYDLIFIDADHTYEYVKKDFFNYNKFLNDSGVIGFHDIDNPVCLGVNKFWNELKGTGKYEQQEFVCRGYPLQYGIGMLTLK